MIIFLELFPSNSVIPMPIFRKVWSGFDNYEIRGHWTALKSIFRSKCPVAVYWLVSQGQSDKKGGGTVVVKGANGDLEILPIMILMAGEEF